MSYWVNKNTAKPEQPPALVEIPIQMPRPSSTKIFIRVSEEWQNKVKVALLSIVEEDADNSVVIRLLLDIRAIFAGKVIDQIGSGALVEELKGLKEAPWSTIKNGGLTQHSLAKLLGTFKIKPRQLTVGGVNTRGYELERFDDVFKRYIPSELLVDLKRLNR